MGTNFYWKVPEQQAITLPTGTVIEPSRYDFDDPRFHIGKRSAAGHYCWDCGVTLCADGQDKIHAGHSRWLNACPECGATKVQDDEHNPAMVELGFAKTRTGKPTGVRGCSSFTWAQEPETVGGLCRAHPDEELIEDEYGRAFTCGAFLTMLEHNCPIQFTEMVGRWFS